ncbi:imidazoleglycerol-phosphate dehydratase HisB [Desulfonatronospira sp.]|uniref:imidazoleglycerol-phosphate dehydratase HisB n=1 Tax=Desulfonatronospira sp. TaxID=1962951 RepID=UPI0025C14CB0|nr:imidazoleglycerol-phosphate dehydratase HisB [Desulfonatronospira sp.]
MRQASINRKTLETEIDLDLVLEPQELHIVAETGVGFLDHMLNLMAHWAGFTLRLKCRGDLHVDFHHSLEDVGICLGLALDKALGDKTGINRVGCAKVPLDEALCECVLDISGRPYLVYLGDDILPAQIAGEEKDVWREFFKSLAYNSRMNLHLNFHYGQNGHHLLESAFKSLGLALGQAVVLGRRGVLSTKGVLA